MPLHPKVFENLRQRIRILDRDPRRFLRHPRAELVRGGRIEWRGDIEFGEDFRLAA